MHRVHRQNMHVDGKAWSLF